MSTHERVPQVTPKRRATPLQISIGLQSAVANFVQVARQRGTTASDVVGSEGVVTAIATTARRSGSPGDRSWETTPDRRPAAIVPDTNRARLLRLAFRPTPGASWGWS